MDTQIWYSVFCTIFGGMCGIIHHLGEVRSGAIKTGIYFRCLYILIWNTHLDSYNGNGEKSILYLARGVQYLSCSSFNDDKEKGNIA
jgi:hypothetical protein